MESSTLVAIHLAKNVFRVHGATRDGVVAFRRKLRRAQVLGFMAAQAPATGAMEACAKAHWWGLAVHRG